MRTFLSGLCGLLAITAADGYSTAFGQSTAEYTVTFQATWSEATHPLDFPGNPHFSGLIGGTHDGDVAFWELCELASDGMELMAETGSKTGLESEVEGAITAGKAEFVLSGGGIGNSPDAVELSFDISEDYPLVTLVSMVAPSPDWWVGVGGLDLRPGGVWVDNLLVDLVVYDSGTDNGTEYTSSNMNTDPAEPIFIKTDGPFAENNIVGTFTFSREVSAVDDHETTSLALLSPLSANPLRDVARFSIATDLLAEARDAQIELGIFDVQGARVRSLVDEVDLRNASFVEWDGRDGRGKRVPTGIYFLRLRANRLAQTVKILVAR